MARPSNRRMPTVGDQITKLLILTHNELDFYHHENGQFPANDTAELFGPLRRAARTQGISMAYQVAGNDYVVTLRPNDQKQGISCELVLNRDGIFAPSGSVPVGTTQPSPQWRKVYQFSPSAN